MKKRALCWLLVLVMVFSLLPLSALAEDAKGVYAIFGEGDAATPARTVYKFVAHDKAYTFNNDQGKSTDQQILKNGDVLYDVGEPMPNAHETFDGWYIDDQKVEFGKPMTVTANAEVEVVARFTEMHTVTFYADEAGTVVLTVKEVAKNADLAIDGLKAPAAAATSNFAYWTDGTNQYAADGTAQNVTADVELKPVFSTGAWLSFFADGGSYNAPQFFEGGNVASGTALPVPTRAGYTFAGWYDGSAQVTNAQGRVTSAISIPADGKTLTAQWTANSNVAYKVTYWQENANDDGYSLAEIADRTGTAGSDAAYQNKNYQGFTLNTDKTNAAATTIKGDGTTIRNVYFDRNEYTVYFYRSSGSLYNELTITAKYGQDIYQEWPSTKYPDAGYPTQWRVGSSSASRIEGSCPVMPLDGQRFYAYNSSGRYTINDEYYLDDLNGVPTYSTKYSFSDKDDSNRWTVTEPFDIDGFSFVQGGNAVCSDGVRRYFSSVGNRYTNTSGNTYAALLHFTRNSYNLTFIPNGGAAVPTQSVKYEAPLSSMEPASYVVGTTTKNVDGVTWIFQGWYDNDSFVGEPFDFDSTMPAKSVTLYAKWAQEEYRIDIDPNGGVLSGTEATFTWKKAGDTIDRYDDVTRDYVENANGTFYYNYHSYGKVSVEDSENSAPADRVAQYVTAPAKYTDDAKYVKEEGAYSLIGWYIENADGTRSVCPPTMEVTGATKLVAEWRRSGEFTVKYDAGEHGTVTAPDTKHYVDQAETVTAVAPTAKDGCVFTGWLLNGETYVPGDPFIVDAELADSTKTITLTAQYRPADEAGTVPTAAIKWHANNGTDAAETDKVALNEAVAIRPADTFTYAGHTFLGWAKTPNAGMNDLFLKADGTAFQAQKDGAWEAVKQVATNSISENNDLYAIWMENATYVVDFNAKMKLADEAAIADPTSKNGDFSLDGTTAVYQLMQLSKDQKLANGAALTFDGVDTAVITGKFYADGAAAADPALKHVTVIPADNVYFDDDLVEKTVAVGDGSGYNADVQFANAEKMAAGSYTFTFNGTGVDIYCTTNGDTGSIVAKLTDKDGKTTYQGMYNHAETERYNIPTISYRDLAYGTYTVTLTVVNGIEYRFDGVRIYNPTNNGTQFANMRDALLNDGKNTKVVGNVDDKDAQSGVLFVDDRSKMALEQDQIDAQTQKPTGKTIEVYKSDFEAYKANSPKNEIYLGYEGMPQTDGSTVAANQSLTFALTEEARSAGVWIGLSAPDSNGQTGKVKIGNKTVDVTSAVDMYYPITADMIGDGGVVTITNTGNAMISVTNLKVTGMESAAGASSLFAPITERIVKIAANNGVDPDQVKDAWNANAWNPKQMLNALFQLLMQSLSGLFNGLGNW